MPEDAVCSIDGCDLALYRKGWCGKHHRRWRRHGDPLVVLSNRGKPAPDRFWEKVNKNAPPPEFAPHLGACWRWTANLNNRGYGMFLDLNKRRSSPMLAHRWAYEEIVGPIPQGLEIDHLCRVTDCVNPAHLEAVTPKENIRRSSVSEATRLRNIARHGMPRNRRTKAQLAAAKQAGSVGALGRGL